jgi:hypothetical protein
VSLDTSVDAVAGALEDVFSELLRQRLVSAVAVAQPAAGAEWSSPIGNVSFVELLAVSYQLVTSAVAANRQSSLLIKDANGIVLGEADAGAVQVAAGTKQYVFQHDLGAPQSIVALTQSVPLGGVPLQPGWSIGSLTGAIDVGDQYKNIVLIVRTWTADAIVRQAEWIARRFPDFAVQP